MKDFLDKEQENWDNLGYLISFLVIGKQLRIVQFPRPVRLGNLSMVIIETTREAAEASS